MQFYEFCMPSNPPNKNVGWNIGWKEVFLFKQCCAAEAGKKSLQHNVGHSKSMLMQVQDPLSFRVWGNNVGTQFSNKKLANIFPLSWLPCGEAHIFAGNTDKWVKLQWKCAKCPSCHNSLFNLFVFFGVFVNATNNSNTVTTLVFAQYIQHRGNTSLLVAFVMQEHQ